VAGDLLWAQADGTVSKTKPTPPTVLVFVGTYIGGSVVHVDVKVFPSLSELSHVKIETPAEFDVMIWDPGEFAFVPRQIDHGADLAGLADDDHVRYFDKDGSKDMTGTLIAPLGIRGIILASFGFSVGQYSVGSADTQLTSYDVTIPANTLTQPGDFIMIEGVFVFATNTNTKTVRHQLDSTTKSISAQSAVSLAAHVPRTVTKLIYRTSTTGAWGGVSWIDASAAAPTAGQGYEHVVGLSGADWTAAQTLKLWAQGGVNDDVRATDFTVTAFAVISGTTV
ncbi:hypothetical protein LCGC14_2708310, partial [marine sediment metagenome]